MLPLKADLPTRSFPLVTVGLILINIGVFLFGISQGPSTWAMFFSYGAIPSQMVHGFDAGRLPFPIIKSIFTSMFIHGGFMHMGGNMLYLWIFGNNVEDEMGHSRFIVFYLLCGVIAAYSQALIDSNSNVPMVGASGAVAGILGAYFLLFPRAKILTLLPIGIFIQIVRIPAVIVIGLWIAVQLIYAFLDVQGAGGVAWFAHIGGFIVGMLLIRSFRKKRSRWQRDL